MPVTFTVRSKNADVDLSGRIESVRLTPLHEQIADLLYTESQEAFRAQESPSGEEWAELSPATLELGFRKRYPDERPYKTANGQQVPTSKFLQYVNGKQILIGQGTRGGLRALAKAADEESARVGSNKPYARIQQLGSDGKMKGFIKSELPPRPYVGASEEDRSAIAEMVTDFYREHITGEAS